MSDQPKETATTIGAFLGAQLGAIVRRAVVRHSDMRSDAFFEALQRELAKAKCAIVRTDTNA